MAAIWRYETQIIAACEEQLNRTLARLECQMSPRVILVGMNCLTGAIVITPDSAPVTPEDLQEHINGLAGRHITHPQANITDAEWDLEATRFDNYCWECWNQFYEALRAVVCQSQYICSISPCYQINGYMVAIAVIYSREQYERYPHMDMNVFTSHGRWPSLHFGVVESVLHAFGEELRKRDAGRKVFETVERDRLLRMTAEFFTRCNVWAGKRFSELDVQLRGSLDFFDACNTISSMLYESQQASGGMLIADNGHIAVDVDMQTSLPIRVDNYHRVRKLVEMCTDGLSVLTDSRYVWGLGRFNAARYDADRADVLDVRFHGHGRWVLSHLGTELMDVRRGDPHLPRAPLDLTLLGARLSKLFGNSVAEQRLIEAIQHVTRVEHGAMLVISQNAAAEGERLTGKPGGFKAFNPTESTMAAATAIDGAVLLDPQGRCQGVGLILDGEAGPNEEPGRGARYNSAIRYLRRCSEQHIQCVIVTVSEDGIINVLPT